MNLEEAVKDMQSKVSFDHDKHVYVNLATGYPLQGVSSISSILPKDWLAAWGAKEAVKALGYSDYKEDTARAQEVLAKIKSSTLSQYLTLLKEAKGAFTKKSGKALLDGKTGHAWLEDYVKARIDKAPLPKTPTGALNRPLELFVSWEETFVQEWLLSEAIVAYPEKGFAGTLDAVARLKNGDLALIDFKFANHVGPDYFLQTAGYALAFEPYGISFDKRIIIRLPKTLEHDRWDGKKYVKELNTLEVTTVPTAYEEDKAIFLHSLALKSWVNRMTLPS